MPYRSVIIAALQAAGLYAVGFILPIIGQIAIMFVPVPLVSNYVREGRGPGLAAVLLSSAFVVAMSAGQFLPVLLFAGLGLMALGLAEGLLGHWRPESAVLLGGGLPVIVAIGVLMLKSGSNPVAFTETYLHSVIADARALYVSAGMNDLAQALDAVSDKVIYYIARLLPGLLLATGLMQAMACYGMARSLVLRKRPDRLPAVLVTLAGWHAPDTWVWGLIVSLGMVALTGGASRIVGLNAAMVFLLVYTTQGIAVIEYVLRRARVAPLWRSFLHTIILALPTVVGVVALGVVDIWADFRKIRKPQVPQA